MEKQTTINQGVQIFIFITKQNVELLSHTLYFFSFIL